MAGDRRARAGLWLTAAGVGALLWSGLAGSGRPAAAAATRVEGESGGCTGGSTYTPGGTKWSPGGAGSGYRYANPHPVTIVCSVTVPGGETGTALLYGGELSSTHPRHVNLSVNGATTQRLTAPSMAASNPWSGTVTVDMPSGSNSITFWTDAGSGVDLVVDYFEVTSSTTPTTTTAPATTTTTAPATTTTTAATTTTTTAPATTTTTIPACGDACKTAHDVGRLRSEALFGMGLGLLGLGVLCGRRP